MLTGLRITNLRYIYTLNKYFSNKYMHMQIKYMLVLNKFIHMQKKYMLMQNKYKQIKYMHVQHKYMLMQYKNT